MYDEHPMQILAKEREVVAQATEAWETSLPWPSLSVSEPTFKVHMFTSIYMKLI